MQVFKFKHGGKTTVTIDDEFIHLERKGAFNTASGLRGKKSISLESVQTVQFKEPGIRAGYIQFGLITGNDRVGVHKAVHDENAVLFSKKELKIAEEIRDIVEKHILNRKAQPSNVSMSIADELKKLADLKDSGILTEEEFQTEKGKLLKN